MQLIGPVSDDLVLCRWPVVDLILEDVVASGSVAVLVKDDRSPCTSCKNSKAKTQMLLSYNHFFYSINQFLYFTVLFLSTEVNSSDELQLFPVQQAQVCLLLSFLPDILSGFSVDVTQVFLSVWLILSQFPCQLVTKTTTQTSCCHID